MKIVILTILAALISSCQNEILSIPGTDNNKISRSGDIYADSALSISSQDSYYWVENTKMPLHKNEGKYFVMYDDSSVEAVETAIQQGTVTLYETLGVVDDDQSTYAYRPDGTSPKNLRTITIQGDPGIENSLLSKVYYWTPYYTMDNGDEVRIGNRFFVKLKSDDDFEILRSIAEKNAVDVVGKVECLETWYKLECTGESRLNALEIANLFQESGLFEYSCPDIFGAGKLCDINEPLYQTGGLWHLGNNFMYPSININYIESRKLISKGSSDVIVAIIDSGVDVNHRDFDGTMLDGWDAHSKTSPNYVSHPHGTMVAGLIGAVPNNNQDVAGVGYGCTILPVSLYVNKDGIILDSSERIAEAINYAVNNGAKVINCSWSSNSSIIKSAIKNALDKGCLVVSAAGNESEGKLPYSASCDDRILVVGAVDKKGQRAWFSNYGPELDVMAPGEYVYTLSINDAVEMASGTSFSAPQVSGLAAMILSMYPKESAEDVMNRIRKTARKIGQGYEYASSMTLGRWDNEMGYGLIDVYAALTIPHRYIIRVKNSSNYQPMIAAKIVIYNMDYSLANITVTNDFGVLYPGEEMTAYCDLPYGNFIINVYPENAGEDYEVDFEINARKGGEISFEFTGSRIGEYRWNTGYLPY